MSNNMYRKPYPLPKEPKIDVPKLVEALKQATVQAVAQGQDWVGFIPAKEFFPVIWEIIDKLAAAGHMPVITRSPDGTLALGIPTAIPTEKKEEVIAEPVTEDKGES